jgi:hypothetical protein
LTASNLAQSMTVTGFCSTLSGMLWYTIKCMNNKRAITGANNDIRCQLKRAVAVQAQSSSVVEAMSSMHALQCIPARYLSKPWLVRYASPDVGVPMRPSWMSVMFL